jgi:hypothetical protein
MRFWQHFRQIGFCRDHDVRCLVLDYDNAADPVLDRRVFALDENAHVERARVAHRVALVDRQVLHEEELLPDRRLQEAEADPRARAEFLEIEFLQAIVEAMEAGQLGIDGEPGVFVNAPIVFVKAEGGRFQGAGGEITADVFLRDDIELGIGFERRGRAGGGRGFRGRGGRGGSRRG